MQNILPSSEQTLECPTCGARQAWSEECRRCRADLSLLVAVLDRYRLLRNRCLQHVSLGDYEAALDRARQLCEISFDEDSARLLASVYLLLGRFQAALRVHDALY